MIDPQEEEDGIKDVTQGVIINKVAKKKKKKNGDCTILTNGTINTNHNHNILLIL